MKKKTIRKIKLETLSVLGAPLFLAAVIAFAAAMAGAVIGVLYLAGMLIQAVGLGGSDIKEGVARAFLLLFAGGGLFMLYSSYLAVKEELQKRIK